MAFPFSFQAALAKNRSTIPRTLCQHSGPMPRSIDGESDNCFLQTQQVTLGPVFCLAAIFCAMAEIRFSWRLALVMAAFLAAALRLASHFWSAYATASLTSSSDSRLDC
jgi:hypothetical protein